jgi:predicted Zn-dependent protease
LLAFADAHFMLALAAEGLEAAAETMLRSMRAAAEDGGSQGAVFKEVGLALCEAIWALGRGAHGEAVDLLHPVRARLWRIGGSHAQRDLFDQMLIEAALGAGRLPLARALLSERTAARPNSGWGWGRYAEALDGLGDTDGAAAARGQQSAL